MLMISRITWQPKVSKQRRKRSVMRKKNINFSLTLFVTVAVIFALLAVLDSPYLSWDYSNPATAVVGTLLHIFEWSFLRLAPFILIGAFIGILTTRKPT